MKKIMALLMVLIICPWEIKACAEDGNITWDLTDTVLTISGEGAIESSPWVIRASFFNIDDDKMEKPLLPLITKIVIEEGITEIGEEIFREHEMVETVTLPKGLKKIGDRAFSICSSLSEINIPDTVTDIGHAAFAACTSLERIELPESLERIGAYVFINGVIEEIYIPKNVIEADFAFLESGTLKNIYVSDENPKYKDIDGVLYSKDGKTLLAYPWSKGGEIVIAEGTETIAGKAFCGANVEKVVIPSSVTTIKDAAFYGCKDLKKIVFSEGEGVQIGKQNFFFCPCDIILPESDFLYEHAFTVEEYTHQLTPWSESKAVYTLAPDYVQATLWVPARGNNLKHTGYFKLPEIFCEILTSVYLNGKKLTLEDIPIYENDRVLVPMRAIFEAMGATVTWDDDEKCAIGEKDDVTVKIKIGENALYKNGKKTEIDSPAEIVDDRTMVPVRAIAEAFGAKVDWDNETRCVIITE